MITFLAGVAQLVEHHLAKVRVAGSSPVARSKKVQVGGLSTGAGARFFALFCPSLAHHLLAIHRDEQGDET